MTCWKKTTGTILSQRTENKHVQCYFHRLTVQQRTFTVNKIAVSVVIVAFAADDQFLSGSNSFTTNATYEAWSTTSML